MVGEANNGFSWTDKASDQGFESIAFNNPTNHTAIALRLALKALRESHPIRVDANAPYILNLDTAKLYARPILQMGIGLAHRSVKKR